MILVVLKEGLRLDTVSLGNRIQHFREQRGLTQEELATQTGISLKHISVLERGLKEPRLATFLNIAEALGVTPNELLSETDDTDCESAIAYRIGQLPKEKQQKLLKILGTLIDEL
jgi:transcriptional regulator with XRE-family HTH domain